MKKIYFLAAMQLIGSGASAQFASSMRYAPIASHPNEHLSNDYNRAPGDVIGSVYDFSTPANWTMSNTGNPSADWVIGTTPPAGFFSQSMGAISSTSGGNFAMFDSDGVGSGTSTQNAVIQLASSVDMSTYSNVAVRFESYYRRFQGHCYLGVSNDGSAWTEYEVHSNVLLNEGTDNPELVQINVSGVAANEGTVWIRFRYEGAWDYAWMIDDVAFVEGYDDQLMLTTTYMSAGAEALDYYMIPSTQIMDITFGAKASNNGVNDQTNTHLTVKVDGGGTYTQASSNVTVPAFSSDTFAVTTAWTPSGPGTYVVDYMISSDQTDQAPDDNVDTLESIIVGGNVYARDNGIISGGVTYVGNPPAPPTVLGNYFEMAGNMTIGKIQVGLHPNAVEGEQMYVEIRVWDGADFVWQGQSADYTIGAGDPGSLVTLELQNPVSVVTDDVIMIGAGHYGSDGVTIATAQAAEGAIIYNDGQPTTQNSVFIVRAEEVFLGIEENEAITGLNIYPNPADKYTLLTYNVNSENNVSLTVTDLSGKVVYTENFGSQVKGQYNYEIKTEEFSNGVYFYSLTIGENTLTKKFAVSH